MEGKKTREKTRELAHSRRQRENDTFLDIAETLPIQENTKDLDKASILRVAIHYLKLRDVLSEGSPSAPDGEEEATLDEDGASMQPAVPESLPISSLLPNFSRDVMQALDGFMMIISRDGRILYTSESIANYLGLRQVDVIGVHVQDIIHPQDFSEVARIFQTHGQDSEQVFDAKNPLKRKFVVRMRCAFTPSTRSITRCSNFKPIYYSAFLKFAQSGPNKGQFLGVVALCRLANITRVKEMCIGTFFKTKHNLDLSYLSIDTRIRWILGYDPAEMVGLKAYQYFHPEDLSVTSSCHMNLLTNGLSHSPCYRFMSRWGDWVWCRSKSHMLFNPISQLPEGIVIFTWIVRIAEDDSRMAAIKEGKTVTEFKKYSTFASSVSSHGGSLDISKLADPTFQLEAPTEDAEDTKPCVEQVDPAPEPVMPVSTPVVHSTPSPPMSNASTPTQPLTLPAKRARPVSSTSLPISHTPPDCPNDRYPPNMNPFDPFSSPALTPEHSPQEFLPATTIHQANDDTAHYSPHSSFIPSPPYTPYNSHSPTKPLPLDQHTPGSCTYSATDLATESSGNSPYAYPTPYESAQSSPQNFRRSLSPSGSSSGSPTKVSPYSVVTSGPNHQAFADDTFEITSEATQFTSDIVGTNATVFSTGNAQFTFGAGFPVPHHHHVPLHSSNFGRSVSLPQERFVPPPVSHYPPQPHQTGIDSGYVSRARARYTQVAGPGRVAAVGMAGGRGEATRGGDRESIMQWSQWLKSGEPAHVF